MGSVQVPEDAYYGAQTARAAANFPISSGIPALVVRALGILKGAAAQANADLQQIPLDIAKGIAAAAKEVADGKLDAEFVVDVFQTGSGTSSNMNANEVIANRAGEIMGQGKHSTAVHPNDHVNRGQSSNDVFPTAVQLGLALAIQERLLPEMQLLADCLHKLADDNFDKIKTGRTHLMDAMPIRYGQEFRGYAGQVERGMHRIREALEGLHEVPLGGTAVGTGVNAHPEFSAKVCALIQKQHQVPLRETSNHFQAQSSLDAVVHTSGAMRSFATALYKLTNDVRWMSSGPLCGIGELKIPAVQPGSSIMPAKVNPVICESVLMLCGQVMANDVAVGFGNSQGQFELNTMFPMMARNAVESALLLANGCMVLRQKCLEDLQVTDVAAANLQLNPILVTALNAAVGYETAAKIAKQAFAERRTVQEVAEELTDLKPDELRKLLDPAALCGDWGKSS